MMLVSIGEGWRSKDDKIMELNRAWWWWKATRIRGVIKIKERKRC